MKLYSLFDSKGDFFGAPFVVENDAMAIRYLSDFIKDNKDSPLFVHKTDYTLFSLGSWDKRTGAIVPEKLCIASIVEVIAKMEV